MKTVFTVERTADGFKYTRGPANSPMVTAITCQLGNRSPAEAALEEGKAWLREAANLASSKVEVTIEW
jgi:hypothetical protein